MNRCVFYYEGDYPTDIPAENKYDGLRYTVCGQDAPFLVNGSSYCAEHVKKALGRTTLKVGRHLQGKETT